jgi:hypothetical protein
MTRQPSWPNNSATKLFPLPIPPTTPIMGLEADTWVRIVGCQPHYLQAAPEARGSTSLKPRASIPSPCTQEEGQGGGCAPRSARMRIPCLSPRPGRRTLATSEAQRNSWKVSPNLLAPKRAKEVLCANRRVVPTALPQPLPGPTRSLIVVHGFCCASPVTTTLRPVSGRVRSPAALARVEARGTLFIAANNYCSPDAPPGFQPPCQILTTNRSPPTHASRSCTIK